MECLYPNFPKKLVSSVDITSVQGHSTNSRTRSNQAAISKIECAFVSHYIKNHEMTFLYVSFILKLKTVSTFSKYHKHQNMFTKSLTADMFAKTLAKLLSPAMQRHARWSVIEISYVRIILHTFYFSKCPNAESITNYVVAYFHLWLILVRHVYILRSSVFCGEGYNSTDPNSFPSTNK